MLADRETFGTDTADQVPDVVEAGDARLLRRGPQRRGPLLRMSGTDASQRTPIASPAVWRAADVADPAAWTIELTNVQRDELATVARRAQAAGRTPATLTRADAPLSALAQVIERVVADLARGRGFALLRRFPVDLLSVEEVALA